MASALAWRGSTFQSGAWPSRPVNEAAAELSADRVFYSCVIDNNARFHFDALRWFATLTRTAEVPARNLIVHAVGDQTSSVLEYLGRHGGRRPEQSRAFDARSPVCNKISAALALASGALPDCVYVLTDSDVAFARDASAAYRGSVLAAKVVDAPNPPLDVLRRAFELARLELPMLVAPDFDRSDGTDRWQL